MLVTSQPTTDEPGVGDPVIVNEPASGAPRPRWARPGLALLLAATALAYLWDLSASGNANTFYAAAVQAGTKSWKAMFFGSIDSSNFITVDKPPASLWVMDISGRIFGFSSWSMLVPEALMGVAAVALVYLTIKRWFGPAAGLVAGATLAVTPVAALMFRFNNPDAFLVLLMVGAAYALTRALEGARTRWIVAVGALLGFAFLAKMLQAFCVLPGFALVYLIAAPTTLRRRIVQLLIGGAAIVVAAGWWVAIVALTPASSRPFVDGSPNNSIINLILGYNGFGRLTGNSSGMPGGGGGGANFSGTPGVFRLFNDLMGGQASWLIPTALVILVAGVVACGRKVRTDRTRAALLLWGSWLVVTGVVFSFGKGVIHTYYTVALAPAIAALVGIGASLLWTHRHRLIARAVAAAALVGTAVWAFVLLDRTPSYHPWVRWVALIGAVVAALALVAGELIPRLGRRVTLGAVALGLVAILSGPLAFTLSTVDTAHTGSIPTAGPASTASAFGGPGGGPGGGRSGGFPGGRPGGAGGFPGGAGGGFPGAAGGAPAFGGSTSGGTAFGGSSSGSTAFGGPASASSSGTGSTSGGAPSGAAGGSAGGPGGMGQGTTSAALVKALEADAKDYRWVAATSGSQSAATLELSTGGDPVMAIGGFSGTGGDLSLATFEAYVAKGDIHYYIASGGGPGGGGPGGGNSTSAITSWVESHAKAETIGGETVYDLSSLKTS